MESTNLTPPPDHDAELEAMLRRAQPPLPDAGFSARVVAALPSKPRVDRSRLWFGAGGAIAGLAVVWQRGPSWTALETEFTRLAVSVDDVARMNVDPWAACAFVVVALCLVFAFRLHESLSPTR